jgi:chromate transporter
VLGALALAAVAAGTHELIVLAGAAVTMAVVRVVRNPRGAMALLAAACWHSGGAAAGAFAASQAVQTPFSLWTLFLVFAKAGAVLFGSGYVLLAFLRADLVERMGLLTERQLLDAIAIGQVTPGPVFTTATFIGYLLAGVPGAAIATVGIFLPAFFFVAISGPFVPRLRRSATAGAVLDGVNVASLALMAVVTWQLAASALIDPLTLALCGGSLAALVFFRVNSTWLIATGAAVGLALGNVA